jgi:ABC-type molybdenum transport system ATPase subunit/photorepair protein PhrA
MILVTGPTGSGKSTTLYSLLAERNDPGINISTVEDPIEYTLPGITQCQVNRDKGSTSPRLSEHSCARTRMFCSSEKRVISKQRKPPSRLP